MKSTDTLEVGSVLAVPAPPLEFTFSGVEIEPSTNSDWKPSVKAPDSVLVASMLVPSILYSSCLAVAPKTLWLAAIPPVRDNIPKSGKSIALAETVVKAMKANVVIIFFIISLFSLIVNVFINIY